MGVKPNRQEWCGRRRSRQHGLVYFVSGGRKPKLLPPQDKNRGAAMPRLQEYCLRNSLMRLVSSDQNTGSNWPWITAASERRRSGSA